MLAVSSLLPSESLTHLRGLARQPSAQDPMTVTQQGRLDPHLATQLQRT